MQPNLDGFCEAFLKWKQQRIPLVIVTLIACRGSVPSGLGARMIVGQLEILFGTVGGGKLEQRCLDVAKQRFAGGHHPATELVTWNLQRDLGMSCGGEVTLFFESHFPVDSWQIAVFGAGHVSQALCPILVQLDCELTVIDPRPEWLKKLPAESSRIRKWALDDMPGALDQLRPHSFVLLITMGHGFDFPILQRALTEFQFPFLGVIGSKTKRAKLERQLREQGYAGEMKFACPVGEDFGSHAPIEIALSISAQLLKKRDQRLPLEITPNREQASQTSRPAG